VCRSFSARRTGGGFATSAEADLRFDGRAVVSARHGVEVARLSYVEVAARLGVEAREPVGLYADGSGVRPDEAVVLDPAAVATITGAFAAGAGEVHDGVPGEDVRPIGTVPGVPLGDVHDGERAVVSRSASSHA
jgi:hypothetical protein